MNETDLDPVSSAEIVLPYTELPPTLDFFMEHLGFRLDGIFPADEPAVAVLSGHGLRLRLQRDERASPGVIRLVCRDVARIADGATMLTAPNGTLVLLAEEDPPLELPPLAPEFLVSHYGDGDDWIEGRAGMLYRDLLPGRLGGRYIASHIRIPAGGPVPDYVHYHKIRFQLIYCLAGWVNVVYEDQGPAFAMHEGDCVLQPPGIRHRVLESSPGFEALEIACPAEHETLVDHALELPTLTVQANREFGGQRFVLHRARQAIWADWGDEGFEARDTGIATASGGNVSAQAVRAAGSIRSQPLQSDAELLFYFVLAGSASLALDGRDGVTLDRGDCAAIPAGTRHSFDACAPDLAFLEVRSPAA